MNDTYTESVVKGDESHDAVKEGSSSTGPGSSPNRRQQQSPVDRTVINKAAFKDETAIKVRTVATNARPGPNFIELLSTKICLA